MLKKSFFGILLAVLCFEPFLYARPSDPALLQKEAVSLNAEENEEETAIGINRAVQAAQQEVRDPFAIDPEIEAATAAPLVQAPTGPPIMVDLEGLGFGNEDAYAVIGGEVYYKGDEKKGIKLLEVRRREVDVLVNGGRLTVPLFPDENLKKVKDRAKNKEAQETAVVQQLLKTK